MLGSFVALYLFLGGFGAAVLIAAACWSLLFSRTRSRSKNQSYAFSQIRGWLYGGAFVLLAVAALCLFLDLGRPDRVLLLFSRPTASFISIGTFVLVSCLIISGFLALSNMVFRCRVPAVLRKAAEAFSLVPAVVMLLYTGLYMAWMKAVPLWDNGALPWLLALSSLSSGVSFVFVVVPFNRDWGLLGGWLGAIGRLHRWILVCEVLTLILFVGFALASPFSIESLRMLFDPSGLGPWFVVGFMVLGLLVPLAAEVISAAMRGLRTLMLAEILCISGGLILRFCLVLAGSHWLG